MCCSRPVERVEPAAAPGAFPASSARRPRPLAATGGGRSRRSSAARLASLASAAVLLLVAAGCGKKGDPEPPFRPIPKAVSDLEGWQRDGEILLRFSYPQTTTAGRALPGLTQVEVWEVVRPLTPPAPPAAAATAPTEGAKAEAAATPATGAKEPATAASPMSAEPAPAAPSPTVAPGTGAGAPAAAAPPAQAAATPAAPSTSSAGTALSPPPAGAPPPAATPPPAIPTGPQPLDPRELAGGATLRLKLAGDEIGAATRGGRIAVRLPLPSPLPDKPEVRYYAVKTATARATSAFSNQAVVPVREPPTPPTDLILTPKADGVEVGWSSAAAGLAGFDVYRRDAEVKEFAEPLTQAAADARSVLDRGAAFGHRFIYAVTAVGSRQPLLESGITETREIDYRDRFAPPVPASLVALADPGRVRLVWTASGASDLAGYRVSRRRADGDWKPLTAEPIAATEYVDEGLAAGERVAYRVTAVDQIGNESVPAEAATTVPP